MNIKIEKNIPIPKRINALRFYPFLRDMEVGDSFLTEFEYSRANMTKVSNRLRNFARKSNDCKDWKFTTRKWEENKMRVLRLK